MIEQHKNFLSARDFKKVGDRANELFKQRETRYQTNYTTFPDFLISDSAAILIYYIDRDDPICGILLKAFWDNFKLSPQTLAFHFFMPGSFVPWHNDGTYSCAATLYLNDTWDPMHGGMFMYNDTKVKNERNFKGILPKSNLLVRQFDSIWHSTQRTTSDAPIRATVQAFFPLNKDTPTV